jgi:hypothetical protein
MRGADEVPVNINIIGCARSRKKLNPVQFIEPRSPQSDQPIGSVCGSLCQKTDMEIDPASLWESVWRDAGYGSSLRRPVRSAPWLVPTVQRASALAGQLNRIHNVICGLVGRSDCLPPTFHSTPNKQSGSGPSSSDVGSWNCPLTIGIFNQRFLRNQLLLRGVSKHFIRACFPLLHNVVTLSARTSFNVITIY